MSFNAWPDQEVPFTEPRLVPPVPAPASVVSAESLSRALSSAIESNESLICRSSSVASDELMRATVERRDAMTTVRAELDRLPPDAKLTEPVIRQRYPLVPEWLPMLFQIALGGESQRLLPASLSMPPLLLTPCGSSLPGPMLSVLSCKILAKE